MNFDEIKKRKEEYEVVIKELDEKLKIEDEKRAKALEEGFGSVAWAERSQMWNQSIHNIRIEKVRVENKKSLLEKYENFYRSLSPQGMEVFDIVVFLRQHEMNMDFLLR